jgi:N-acetylglucosaminyldiphosphoundecaprenol N-acetyl-beta-D-mannosaminyltransferase
MESLVRGREQRVKPLCLLGVEVHALNLQSLNSLVSRAIAAKHHWIIANHNMHSVYLYHHDSKMRKYFAEAKYIHIDGMYLVYLGRLLGLPLRAEHRTGYVDWLYPLMNRATHQGWRIFYLGSKPGIAARSAQVLREKFPELQIATAHGYFDSRSASWDNQQVISTINEFRPHILMVGMGMPRQEHWILDNHTKISANIILSAGALMDYVAGEIPTPPRWTGYLGVEWLFRLLSEPKRLWHRYLIEPWFVLKVFLNEYRNHLLALDG